MNKTVLTLFEEMVEYHTRPFRQKLEEQNIRISQLTQELENTKKQLEELKKQKDE